MIQVIIQGILNREDHIWSGEYIEYDIHIQAWQFLFYVKSGFWCLFELNPFVLVHLLSLSLTCYLCIQLIGAIHSRSRFRPIFSTFSLTSSTHHNSHNITCLISSKKKKTSFKYIDIWMFFTAQNKPSPKQLAIKLWNMFYLLF